MKDNNSQFKIMDTNLEKQKGSLKEVFLAIVLSLAIAAFLIIPIVSYLINNNLQTTALNYKNNIETKANAKLEVLDSYFDSLFDLSNSITSSDTIKIWVDEYNQNPNNKVIKAQQPYITRTLKEFVDFNKNIIDVNLAAENGSILTYNTNINNNKNKLLKNKNVNIKMFENKLLVLTSVPIYDLENETIIANISYTINATDKLKSILSQKANKLETAKISIKNTKKIPSYISFDKQNHPTLVINFKENNVKLLNIDNLILDNNRIISNSTTLDKHGYKISYNVNLNEAIAQHNQFKYNLYVLAALIAVIISLFFLSMLWKGKNNQTRKLAQQYSKFAKEINKKQSMLEGINTTIDEQISLKNIKGKYMYINDAFSKFFNLKLTNKHTKDEDFIESTKLTKILEQADHEVISKDTPWHKEQLEITHKDGSRYFDITKWPQKDGEDITGIITIARDRTEPILHQRAMEKLQNQSILALVKTVEIKDPHLAGHHARMAYISEIIATSLKLSEDEILTLKYSAQLAGIGKVFVPQALLTKPGKLTTEELEIIQTHILSAKAVLSTIDFSLPISHTIENMYERLDGSGYPMAKKAAEIGKLSRILAIADAFCALIVPRSYRDGISFKEALEILKKQDTQYDVEIIEILEQNINKMTKIKQEFILNLK